MVCSKDLRIPFLWQDRKIILSDKFWFVPPQTSPELSSIKTFDSFSVFGNTNPIAIEYCSGNGSWICSKALHFPNINWIAVEKKFDRASKIWARAKNAQLENLVIAWAEGIFLTKNFFPEKSVQEVFINFPDPWPKNCHRKHRIITQEFLLELARTLVPNGTVTFVTDSVSYSNIAIKEFNNNSAFCSHFPEPQYSTVPENYGTSYFETLFRNKGLDIRFHKFQNMGCDV